MTATFAEKTLIETGFSEVFQNRIAPRLSELENERKARLATARRHAAIALGAGAVLGLLFVVFGSGSGGMGEMAAGFGVPLAFGGVGALLLWKRQSGKWGGSVAQTVMPVVCDFMGDLRHDHEALKGFPLERMRKLGVIGNYNRSEISDRLEGRYRDTDFELVEARLIREKSSSSSDSDDGSSDRSSRTLFKGLLMRIAVPEPIPTRILIARDFGIGNKLGELLGGSSGRGMPKYDTGHPEFEQYFEVYAADPEIARDVLESAFLDSLLSIAETEGGRHGAQGLQAGFHDEAFFMALRREGDFLAMGSLRTPMDNIEEDLHRIFDDIATIHRIIDRLHGD